MAQQVSWTVLLDVRTTEEWAAETNVIPKGYVCVEQTSDTVSTGAKLVGIKIGDGTRTFSTLRYILAERLQNDLTLNLDGAVTGTATIKQDGTITNLLTNLNSVINERISAIKVDSSNCISVGSAEEPIYGVYASGVVANTVQAAVNVAGNNIVALEGITLGDYDLKTVLNSLATRLAVLDGGASTVID